jgi:magnesium chelatase family protein
MLFLNELPELKRHVLEVLRQPLEDGQITIVRVASKTTCPSQFMLVAAMNPCPCRYLGDPMGQCTYSPERVSHYRSKISGLLLDRIDIHIEIPKIKDKELRSKKI